MPGTRAYGEGPSGASRHAAADEASSGPRPRGEKLRRRPSLSTAGAGARAWTTVRARDAGEGSERQVTQVTQ